MKLSSGIVIVVMIVVSIIVDKKLSLEPRKVQCSELGSHEQRSVPSRAFISRHSDLDCCIWQVPSSAKNKKARTVSMNNMLMIRPTAVSHFTDLYSLSGLYGNIRVSQSCSINTFLVSLLNHDDPENSSGMTVLKKSFTE